MVSSVALIVILPVLSVFGERMDWGDNPNLVEESDTIQGREHIKLMVLMVGESIDLECQVAFTSEPVSPIRWKINGKKKEKDDDPIKFDYSGEVFVEDHLRLVNITEDMDSSTVSCEYSKGQYGASVEAVLRVFKLETTEEYRCNDCKVILTYKEIKRSSPAEESVEKRLKAKIEELFENNVNDIKVDSSGYTLKLPLRTVLDKKLIKNEDALMKKLEKCKQERRGWRNPFPDTEVDFCKIPDQRIPRSFNKWHR